jgi:AcrR family transcriptional regulator
MRKDAEHNRARLVAAASELMRSEGGDFPMERILERANLTRATLYRNFPHRQALYEAVLERDLEALTARLAADPDGDPLAFIRLTTELMVIYDKFLLELAAMADYDAEKNQVRMAQALAAPLASAQAKGRLRRDLTSDDVLTACRMLASHWRLDAASTFEATFERRLSILMGGLAGGGTAASSAIFRNEGHVDLAPSRTQFAAASARPNRKMPQ